MASWRVVTRMFCTAAESAAASGSSKRWETLKTSKVGEKLSTQDISHLVHGDKDTTGLWCRSLVSDYKEACREIIVGAWERPVKATIYAALLGGTWACFHTRPDHSSFEAAVQEYANQLGLLSPWIRNAASDGHVQSLLKLHNEGRLGHASLGLLSLVYSTSYDPDTTLYEAQCSNLSVPWWKISQRVLDVGFAGRWWILDSKMNDYDVNEEEFKHLPSHMQVTSPPSSQEVERNEKLHKESWLMLTVNDEEKETNLVDRKEERGVLVKPQKEEEQTQA